MHLLPQVDGIWMSTLAIRELLAGVVRRYVIVIATTQRETSGYTAAGESSQGMLEFRKR